MAFLVGTLLVTWTTYLTASALRNSDAPMVNANLIVMTALALANVAVIFRRRMRDRQVTEASHPRDMTSDKARLWIDIAVTVTGLVLATTLMFHTCRIVGNTLVLGRTAFGDLNIHLGMARSFSWGVNFPTGYMAYAGSDIRYHFMFYFLVGNLEFLGLPLDWAINLPSILAFTSVLMLLHGTGTAIGRDARVGLLAVFFFLMRSSPAGFVYVWKLPGDLAQKTEQFFGTTKFIGLTTHETWGIWNLNVYAVERHFGFAFGLVLIALLYLVRVTGLDSGPTLLGKHLWARDKRGSPPS
jgi:hypothetical protein